LRSPARAGRPIITAMLFEQIYLGCLAQASYLIGSDGEAAVVDPRRDVEEYVRMAAAKGLRIRYVIETHLHADFVSGHRELAARSGAKGVWIGRAAAMPSEASRGVARIVENLWDAARWIVGPDRPAVTLPRA